jgi:hypothetical protein
MRSVKSIMNCIGVDTTGSASVLFHLFGFFRSRVPTDPEPTVTAQVSLLDHVQSLLGRHVHLNVIRVGIDSFSADEIDRIDYAIYKARNIYRTVDLGVGRVEHYDILTADSNGRNDIGSEAEAEDLTHEWTVPNNGLDVFVVENISADFIGISAVDGPCNKDAGGGMNGVLGGEVNRFREGLARTFAHEVGHYLSLEHNHGDDPDCPGTAAGMLNLMAQTRCVTDIRNAVQLTAGQGNDVRGHCSVQNGC